MLLRSVGGVLAPTVGREVHVHAAPSLDNLEVGSGFPTHPMVSWRDGDMCPDSSRCWAVGSRSADGPTVVHARLARSSLVG